MSDQEEWRPVVGWEGLYEVSSLGRVRSSPGRVAEYIREGASWRRAIPSKILTPYRDAHDYDRVKFSRPTADGHSVKRPKVHILVCQAFHGERPDRRVAAHRDDDRRNNCAANLRWATLAENSEDSRLNGGMAVGARMSTAKLSEGDALYIRASTLSARELAGKFSISAGHAWRIKVGHRWRHISG